MGIREAQESDLEAILEICNEAVINTTATFDLAPRSQEAQAAWFAEHIPPYPLIVWEEDGWVLGRGSIGPYRPRPAYRFAGEASVYVHADARRRGVGEALLRELVALATKNGFHTLIGVITEEDEASVRLAEKTGFRLAGVLAEVGYKFDRWLDMAVYQQRCGS